MKHKNPFSPGAARRALSCMLLALFVFNTSLFSAPKRVTPVTEFCGLCYASYSFLYGETGEGCCIQDPGFPNSVCTVQLCLGDTLYLQPSILTNPDNSVQIFWNFGGAAPNPGPVNYPNPGILVPTSTGTFSINYSAVYPVGPDPILCNVAFQVVVSAPPAPSFTINPNPACVGENLCLDITTPPGTYTSFTFTNIQGVNYPCTAPLPHTSCDDCMSFGQPGTYDIQLDMYNGGCYAGLVEQVVINPFVADFDWSVDCSNPNVATFNNTSQCGNPNLTYLWYVNGSLISSSYPVFTYTFPGPGTYTVLMEGYFWGTLLDSHTETVIISPPIQTPVISYATLDMCDTTPTYTVSNLDPSVTYTWEVTEIGGPLLPFTSNGNGSITANWTSVTPGSSGQVCVFATNASGCADTTCIQILPCCTTTVVFSPLPPLTVCDKGLNLQPYAVGTPPGGTYVFSGTAVTGTNFNPQLSGPGTFIITVTYTAPNGCPPVTATQTVTVLLDGIWNVTTIYSDPNDRGNDIYVDTKGNVYVVGTFEYGTTFPASPCNVTINSGASGPVRGAYVAKYNPCGKLIWVNYDSLPGGYSEGTGLYVDETRNIVFISGIGGGPMRFQATAAKPCIAAVPASSSMTVPWYYAASFKAINGDLITQWQGGTAPPAGTSNFRLTALDGKNTGASTDELYITGDYRRGGSDSVYVCKILYSGSTFTSGWRTTTSPGGAPRVLRSNDIAVSKTNNQVYITGRFGPTIGFPGVTAISTVVQNAFISAFNTANGACINGTLKSAGSVPAQSGQSEGTSVNTDNNGDVFYTGTFTSLLPNIYGFGPNMGAVFGTGRSYIMKLNAANAFAWANQIRSSSGINTTGDIRTSGIVSNGTSVYVTGSIDNGSVTFPAAMVSCGTFTSANSTPKTFVAGLSASNGSAQWMNTTKDALTGSVHSPTRISTSGNFTFSTGGYIGQMDYTCVTGPPFSGPLLSTTGTHQNTYIIRNEISNNGAFREAEEDGDTQTIADQEEGVVVTLYPNPSEGQFNVDIRSLSEQNGTVEIYDLMGKLVEQKAVVASSNTTFDLSTMPRGMYIVKLVLNNKVYTNKVSIQ